MTEREQYKLTDLGWYIAQISEVHSPMNNFSSMDLLHSAVNTDSARETIYKIRDLNKKFRMACRQLVNLNNLIDEMEIRYIRAQTINHRAYRYVLRLRLCSLEGIRNMFYEYAYAQADRLEEMQIELYTKTGYVWNDTVSEETDEEFSESSESEIANEKRGGHGNRHVVSCPSEYPCYTQLWHSNFQQ